MKTNGSFQNHPKLIRDSHHMVLPQTFLYRFSTMHKFQILLKFKLFWCYKSFVLVRLPWLDYMSPMLLNMNLIWTASGKWHSTSRSFLSDIIDLMMLSSYVYVLQHQSKKIKRIKEAISFSQAVDFVIINYFCKTTSYFWRTMLKQVYVSFL